MIKKKQRGVQLNKYWPSDLTWRWCDASRRGGTQPGTPAWVVVVGPLRVPPNRSRGSIFDPENPLCQYRHDSGKPLFSPRVNMMSWHRCKFILHVELNATRMIHISLFINFKQFRILLKIFVLLLSLYGKGTSEASRLITDTPFYGKAKGSVYLAPFPLSLHLLSAFLRPLTLSALVLSCSNPSNKVVEETKANPWSRRVGARIHRNTLSLLLLLPRHYCRLRDPTWVLSLFLDPEYWSSFFVLMVGFILMLPESFGRHRWTRLPSGSPPRTRKNASDLR